MFALAFLLAGFSYIVFFVGLFQLFTRPILFLLVGLMTIAIGVLIWKKITTFRQTLKNIFHQKKDHFVVALLSILVLQLFIDSLGVLSPETAFDALWYHLTIPKLFLLHGGVYHIPGGLLYYTDMPKLAEMLYLVGLSMGSDITVHVIHFFFGILTLIALYFLGRRFFSPRVSLIGVAIFATNIIFHWEITTAYIDVVRTFYEVMALWAFVLWNDTRKRKWLSAASILIGCSIAIKLISVISIALFSLLIITVLLQRKEKTLMIIESTLLFAGLSLCVPLPYFIYNFLHTGNPVFPLFSSTYPMHPFPFYNPTFFIWTFWNIFTHAGDVISPLYIIFLPLLILIRKKLYVKYSMLYLYTILGLVLWYFIPQRNEARFLLPVLPGFSLLCAALFTLKWPRMKQAFFLSLIFAALVIAVGYRLITNIRYLPVILGRESRNTFLTKGLNFSFGDFYDTDRYFLTHIKPGDNVLLYGFHNLYYVDFPFIDNSWVQKGDTFRYIAVQNGKIPRRFADWELVYENPITHVQLYEKGNKKWVY